MKKKKLFLVLFTAIANIALVVIGIFTAQPIYKIISSCLSIVMLSFLVYGNKVAFIVGIAYYSLYTVICFTEKIYGAAIITIACAIPIQIISFIKWNKTEKSSGKSVVKLLSNKWRIISVLGTAAMTVGLFFLLSALASTSPTFDAISTALCVTALILLPFGVIEQWIYNCLGNLFGAILWASTLSINIGNINVVIVFAIFTINSILGLFFWLKNYQIEKRTISQNKN